MAVTSASVNPLSAKHRAARPGWWWASRIRSMVTKSAKAKLPDACPLGKEKSSGFPKSPVTPLSELQGRGLRTIILMTPTKIAVTENVQKREAAKRFAGVQK